MHFELALDPSTCLYWCKPLKVHFFFFFLRYAGLSLLWSFPLQSTGSGRAGSAAMAHRPSRSAACGIFPDRGMNPCPLHRQADCQPLRHQGSPGYYIFMTFQSFCSHFAHTYFDSSLFKQFAFIEAWLTFIFLFLETTFSAHIPVSTVCVTFRRP